MDRKQWDESNHLDNEAAGFKTNTSSTVANTESSSTDEAVDLSSFSLYKERQCPCLLEMEDGIDGIPYVMVEEQQSFLWYNETSVRRKKGHKN